MNKNITVEEILKATNGTFIYGSKLEECENFSKNTKEIKEGDVYIGLKESVLMVESFMKTLWKMEQKEQL